jgi:hypothetical protein
MDINVLGVGAIIGSVMVVGANLFIAWQNRRRDDIKERLEKLFLPMRRVLQKPKAMENNYETFLEIEKLYTKYEHLASPMLVFVIHDIVYTYRSLLRDTLTENEIEEKIKENKYKNYKNISRNLNELVYDIYGIVDASTEELLRQYRGGLKLHILNFLQFFSSSPYSAKTWKEKFIGYKNDA